MYAHGLRRATREPSQNLLRSRERTDKEKGHKLLHQIFDGYAATADFPGMVFADDLMEMYPDAKVILNKRDSAERWHRSIAGTLKFFSQAPYLLMTCPYRAITGTGRSTGSQGLNQAALWVRRWARRRLCAGAVRQTQ